MSYLGEIRNGLIKEEITSNLSVVVYLTSLALVQDNEDYLVFINGLLDDMIKDITDDTIEIDEN